MRPLLKLKNRNPNYLSVYCEKENIDRAIEIQYMVLFSKQNSIQFGPGQSATS